MCVPRRKQSCFWIFFVPSDWFFFWSENSSYRWRRLQIIDGVNHLHFFDLLHSFRGAHHDLEYFLPTSKRGRCGELVKMKRESPSLKMTESWFDGRIWHLRSCGLSFLSTCGRMERLLSWRIPLTQFLRIRCWWRHIWICKNVSRCTMCVPNAWRPFSAARRNERMSQHPFRYSMRWEWHWSTCNVWISNVYRFTIHFILQFLYSVRKFQDSISILVQSSPWNCVECWALKSLQFLPFHWTFFMRLTNTPILFQQLFMKNFFDLVGIVRLLEMHDKFHFVETRQFHSWFGYPSQSAWNSCSKFLFYNQREFALFIVPGKFWIAHSLSRNIFCRLKSVTRTHWKHIFMFWNGRKTMTELATTFLHDSVELVHGPLDLLAPEWTMVKRAFSSSCKIESLLSLEDCLSSPLDS